MVDKIDKTKPTCGAWSGTSTTWTNGNRQVKVACSDNVACTAAKFNGTNFTTTTKTSDDSAVIKDKAGNTRTCTGKNLNVYVDKKKPSTPEWGLKGTEASVKCKDSDGDINSGIDRKKSHGTDDSGKGKSKKTWTLSGTSDVTKTITCYDKAGNSKEYSHTYKYDSCLSEIDTCVGGNEEVEYVGTCPWRSSCNDGYEGSCPEAHCHVTGCNTGICSCAPDTDMPCKKKKTVYNDCITGNHHTCVGGFKK